MSLPFDSGLLMSTSPNRVWLTFPYLASASGTKKAMWLLPWSLKHLCLEPWTAMWEVWLPWGVHIVKKPSYTERSCVNALVGNLSLWVILCPVTNLWIKLSWTLQTSSSASWELLSDLSQCYREQKDHWDEQFPRFLTHMIYQKIKWLVSSV